MIRTLLYHEEVTFGVKMASPLGLCGFVVDDVTDKSLTVQPALCAKGALLGLNPLAASISGTQARLAKVGYRPTVT